jgi:cobyrinic acid a,c-diamide synthase
LLFDMTLVIAGERSGVGKTTATLALLASLQRRGLKVQSFKVGPDYIDPMFHHRCTGLAGRNLDPVLTSEAYVQQCFTRYTQGVDYALVEGVMGLFDGVSSLVNCHLSSVNKERQMTNDKGQITDWASTAHIARLLDLPVVLVIDCSRLSGSVAAITHGYRSFDPRIKFAGLVLNRVGSDRHLELLKNALEPLKLPVLGVLRRQDNITIPDRHLGLVPTAEIPQMDALIDRLAHLGDSCFDWERLMPLLQVGTPPNRPANGGETPSPLPLTRREAGVKIAVARDRAFNFYYQDNLDLLQELGAELIFWSPLADSGLPQGVQGMYFGGGFPEVFAQELTNNSPALNAVRQAILSGMPTYAECGGLMYLCQQLVDFEGRPSPMVGVLPTTSVMSSRLVLGYRQAVALQDSPLLPAGTIVWGHEFHRSYLSEMPTKPLYETRGYSKQSSAVLEGWRSHQLHASYVHLHFGARPEIPARFLQSCAIA